MPRLPPIRFGESSISGLTAGLLTYGDTDGSLAQASTLKWDTSGSQLLVGTATANANGKLQVSTDGNTYSWATRTNAAIFATSATDMCILAAKRSSVQELILCLDSASSYIGTVSATPFSLMTNGSNQLTVSSGGLVGINKVPNAGTALDVNGSVNALTDYRLNGATYSRIAIADNGGGWGGGYNFTISGATPQHDSLGSAAGIQYTAGATQFFNNASAAAATNIPVSLSIDNNRNVAVGNAALATNATDGFFYIPTCAGTPTGAPTAKTGRVPLIYDTTNNKLYVYNGAWKGGTAPGAWS